MRLRSRRASAAVWAGSSASSAGGRLDPLLEGKTPLVKRAAEDGATDAATTLAARPSELAQMLERADAAAGDDGQPGLLRQRGGSAHVWSDLGTVSLDVGVQ